MFFSVLAERNGGCYLPRQPEFGSYKADCSEDKPPCILVPGALVAEHWLISFRCNDGYYINGSQNNEYLVFCNKGNWHTEIPTCRRE